MLSHLGGKVQIMKMGCNRNASNPMVALFNIPYPFLLGKPYSETWNSDVPGGSNGSALPWACASGRQSAFQQEAVFLQSSAAARRLLNLTCFTCLAFGYSWGSLQLKVCPPQVTQAVRSITPMCLHQQRQCRECILGLEGQHAEHKEGTGPSVTCHACTQFGKPLIHPNLNKLGLARRKHTGMQHLSCIFPSNGSREHEEAQSVVSSCNSAGRANFPLVPPTPQAHRRQSQNYEIGLKLTWEIFSLPFDPIAILHLFFTISIIHIFGGLLTPKLGTPNLL